MPPASLRQPSEKSGLALPRASRDLIRRRLQAWYRSAQRDLPWRRTRDPYRIWLSETMLQQTRVDSVIPYYERFLERFPDVQALALADEQDVLRAWSGLGYYARARNLKRAAECIVRDHAGELPRAAEQLAALPGVGPYTVGAIRSIAFGERAAVVDGNVVRVLSRLLAAPELAPAHLWRIAEELVPGAAPDQFNQALMELGATLCVPRSPACPRCPLSGCCAAWAMGRPEAYPAPRPKPKPREVEAISGLLERGGGRPRALLLLRRPSKGLLGGLWEIPSVAGDRPQALVASLRERTGLRARAEGELGRVRHIFSHRALTLRVVRLSRPSGRLRPGSDARWCSPSELQGLPLSALMKKTLRLAHY